MSFNSVYFLTLFLGLAATATEAKHHLLTHPCFNENVTQNYNSSDIIEDLEKLDSNNTAVNITEGYHYLHHYNFTIKNKRNVSLRGIIRDDTRPAVICCNQSAFNFMSITNLRIEGLVFVGCGFIIHRNMKIPPAAILVHGSQNITLANVKIIKSKCVGLAVLNTTGTNLIRGCHFISNGNETANKLIDDNSNGGGMLIYAERITSNSNYHITECLFEENVKKLYLKQSKNYDTGHGGGLMLSLHSIRASHEFRVNISNTGFIENAAENGGGALIELFKTINSSIHIYNCVFEGNTAKSSVISNGGGLQIKFFGERYNYVTIAQCKFLRNEAYFGGGLSADCGFKYHNNLFVKDSILMSNNATSGAAVDITHSYPLKPGQYESLEPTFSNCNFTGNVISYKKYETYFAVGYGAFAASGTSFHFESNIAFNNNKGSAISGTLATIIINEHSTLTFQGNSGINGGALSLKSARLLLFKNTTIKFISNHASRYGGALYSIVTDDHMLFTITSCPFTFYKCIPTAKDDCNVSVFFEHNKAEEAGNAIYVTSVLPCQLCFSQRRKPMIYAKDVFKLAFFKSDLSKNDIRTAPSKIRDKNSSVAVYPGAENKLRVTLKDDLNNIVPSNLTILEATIIQPQSKSLKLKDTYIHNYKFTMLGHPNTVVMVNFQTIEKPLLIISRKITMKLCPPAYILQNNKCECNESAYYGIKSCSDQNFNAFIRKGVWCGYEDDHFVTGPCHWFCRGESRYSNKDSTKIQFDRIKKTPQNQDFLCSDNREGLFCSKCKEGHTVYYHDDFFFCGPEKDCTWGWLIFIASELLPVTLLFIVIIVTGFNVTCGNIQGFLLYCHILYSFPQKQKDTIHWDFIYNVYDYSLHLFYFPLNLKFFCFRNASFCLFPGANSLDVALIGYIKNIYCFLLIFIVAFFLRCFVAHCRSCHKWIRYTTAKNSALIGISALLVLSYISAVELSLIILQVSPLYNSSKSIHSLRVAVYGHTKYFSHHHMIYAIPACICLAVLLVPALMLFTYPLVLNLLSYFKIDAGQSWIGIICTKGYMYTKLKPFYDMFYASFKDKHRYFAGLYFIYRVIVQLTYYFPFYIEESFAMEGFLVIFLILHAAIQPYQKKIHNIVDALLLGNLVIINGIITINTVIINMGKTNFLWDPQKGTYIQYLLSIFPMYSVFAYIFWKYVLIKLWRKLKRIRQGRGEYQQLVESASCHLNHHRLADASIECNNQLKKD
uniref:Right handed beta helix domain-containing protein n=1 Tax=Amphimedon queenslandica TaxID=400682 RepID=A0A1X7UBR7_AMPQE